VPPPVATVDSGSSIELTSAWLRSTVIQGCGVNTPSVSRVMRVRIGSAALVASVFQEPPAGTTIGGVTRVCGRPLAVMVPTGSLMGLMRRVSPSL
jgi:hypothetical protein